MSDLIGRQLTPEGLKDLIGASGFRLIQTEVPGPDTPVSVGPIPKGSLQAVFDLLSHWGPGNRRLNDGHLAYSLRVYTNMSDEEIRKTIIYLDTLYDLLYSAGMRPTKMKREVVRGSVGSVVRVQK